MKPNKRTLVDHRVRGASTSERTRSGRMCTSLPGRSGNCNGHDEQGRGVQRGRTNAAHEPGAVVPVHRALARIAGAADVTLPAKEDGVDERLGLVEVREEEDGRRDEGKEDC